MPLIKRAIEPCNLSRTRVPQGVRNELECVTNGTLANVIRQLSGLSKHAEDMFGELYRETGSILHRASQLQERVEKLQVKVTQLDSTVEEVSLHDINLRKPFKSSVIKDQQVISLATRPLAIADAYKKCEAPPVLDKLNPYREDGKDSMKFYTDPTYFFELWCHEMQRDTENQKKEIHRKRQKRHKSPKTRGQAHVREAVSRRDELQKYKHGKEFAPEHMRNTPHNHVHHHHLHHHPHNQMPPHALQQQHSYPGGRPRSSNQRMSQACGGGAAPAPMRQLSQPDPRASQPSASNIENRSPSRPSSLELSAAQYQQIQNYAKAEKAAANAASAASAASNSQQVNGLAASSGGQQAHFDGPTANSSEETHVPHYQPPPPYMHADLARSTDRNSPLAESPHHTPKRAGTPSSGPRTPSTVVSPRPSQPPPAPPPGTIQSSSPMGSRSGSTSRESLPPPPPPPPGQQSEVSQTPPYSSPVHAVMTSLREESSPVRHTPSPQAKTSTPDSMTDFPPPPPPPPQLPGGTPDTPSSIHAMPPPPATPPPPEMHDLGIHNDIDHHRTTAAPPPPPPPPPPLAEGLLQESKFMANAGLSVATALVAQIDAISLNSNGSSATMSSASTGRSEETRGAEPVVDERSDLLAAIREGIQLRKVEEQRHKQEQRLHPRGRLDVQSIMEQAFEMRRKALEENGSDDDEEEYDDEDWSDEG